VPGSIAVQFFGDPEAGLAAAAPYLGLQRRYHVADDEALYLEALRYYLSQGHVVRLGLDAAVLYDLDEPSPHSEVLVGYDAVGFHYYETVCLPESPCEPCHLPPGEEGLWISEETLLEAVESQAEMFTYPWRYSLTIFEAAPREEDLRPIWRRNGTLLIGGARYGPRQGADAIEELAGNVHKRGARVDVSAVSPALGAAVVTRRANAAYLREAFAGQDDLERAAALFDRAADDYEAALSDLENGIADQAEAGRIAAWLRDAGRGRGRARGGRNPPCSGAVSTGMSRLVAPWKGVLGMAIEQGDVAMQRGIVDLILKAVALGLAVASIVLSILNAASIDTRMSLLSIGLLALALAELQGAGAD
jgi:hypothetical protein